MPAPSEDEVRVRGRVIARRDIRLQRCLGLRRVARRLSLRLGRLLARLHLYRQTEQPIAQPSRSSH